MFTNFKQLKIKKNYSFDMIDDKMFFNSYEYTKNNDELDKIKFFLKKNEFIFNFLKYLISPVYFDNQLKNFTNKYIIPSNKIALNLGSGNYQINKNIINIDMVPYKNVNIVCDIDDLPFEDNSIDVILTSSVLEHVKDPYKVINEIHRVLKVGGIIYTDVPFIVGFHASPFDYHRWTKKGIENLHIQFEQISIRQSGGPTSALLWIFQEFIATIFSLGNKKLHTYIYILIMTLTFPFKFLDIFLNKISTSENISSGFIYIGKKYNDTIIHSKNI